ncbi:MAG: bifunctional UDP-3-O-[3-hydroxymyristoyl] N-acetylglucosamine deacetylase/3-hydroxyacyl-ACP dehydratase [Opitutales bacterium]
MKQRTLIRDASIQGKALHSGEAVQLTLKPAPPDHGIVFRRTDLDGRPQIKPGADLVTESVRNTTVNDGQTSIHTVEHVLSALTGMGIDNALVEMNASEPPILDGSAKDYVRLIEEAQTVEQDRDQHIFELDAPIVVSQGNRSIAALPYDGFKITCTSADDRGIHTQHFTIELDPENYRSQIASARTFTIYEDIEELLKIGKIQGGSLDSAIVIKGNKVISKEPLRFKDEFVRHKILDIVGDLTLAGVPFKAHIVAVLPGHTLNVELARKLREKFLTPPRDALPGRNGHHANGTKAPPAPAPTEMEPANDKHDLSKLRAYNIREVLDVLPHRYPFILIDRVLEIEPSKSIRAIKNVTINEPYFQGHFPGQPVMPGVLQIEAMAQAGGILMLSSVNKPGSVCYFMSCEKVKFRKAVTPGDQLEVHVSLIKERNRKIALMAGECHVDGKLVSSGELMFTLVEEGATP